MSASRDSAGRFLAGHSSPGPGRGTRYDATMNERAGKLALLGLTDEQIAAFFDVDARTLDRWKIRHPAFCWSLMEGKTIADANVADALHRRAVGQWIEVEQTWREDQSGRRTLVAVRTFRPADRRNQFQHPRQRWLALLAVPQP